MKKGTLARVMKASSQASAIALPWLDFALFTGYVMTNAVA